MILRDEKQISGADGPDDGREAYTKMQMGKPLQIEKDIFFFIISQCYNAHNDKKFSSIL